VIEFLVWIAFLSLIPLSEGVLLGSINIVAIMIAGRFLFGEKLTHCVWPASAGDTRRGHRRSRRMKRFYLIGFLLLMTFDTLAQISFKYAGTHALPVAASVAWVLRVFGSRGSMAR
jgi:hypothetical protein